MNELKGCHSVLSLIPVNPTFFVPLPFTAHIPQPVPIWNTKVWPLLHLTQTRMHAHTRPHALVLTNLLITLFLQDCVGVLMNIDVVFASA